MNHIGKNKRPVRGGTLRVAPAMTLGLVLLLTGCESLLEVDLPSTITVDELKNPTFAEVLTNSAIARTECAVTRLQGGNGFSS